MKVLVLGLSVIAFNLKAEVVSYNCQKLNAKLIKTSESNYVLKSFLGSTDCKMGYTNFPGTEVEMKLLKCANKKEYYFTQYNDETIILSKGFVWSTNIECFKE